jgi:Zn-finger nucleic acid-binding protein
MNCPACDSPALVLSEFHVGLAGLTCGKCQGSWIRSSAYNTWRRSGAIASAAASSETLNAQPTQMPAGRVRRCSDCHAFLGRYRVGAEASFQIDRCGQCDGTWLDRNEWQQLLQLGLAAQLMSVFSPEWQQKVRKAEQLAAHERRFAARIEAADLQRAKEVRTWLAEHPQRGAILAYLELLPARAVADVES